MGRRLTYGNNYQAAAASGVGGNDDYIAVDLTPDELDSSMPSAPTRDSIFLPITITWTDAGVDYHLETICTGWQASPKQLFIEPMYFAGTNGNAAAIFSAPNRQAMECYQLSQDVAGTLAASGQYDAEHGITHYVSVTGAGTVSVEYQVDNNGAPWDNYTQVFNNGHVTRLIMTDAGATQPAITWATTYGNIVWENGSPQFVAGKTRMVVELVGGGGTLFGSFKLFA